MVRMVKGYVRMIYVMEENNFLQKPTQFLIYFEK
jgi:hypothetical protein